MDEEIILEAQGVTYSYSRKGQKVLDNFDIKIKKGVKTAILGCNGAGKSTLFSVLNALYKPQEGRVLYKGKPLSYHHKGIIKMRSEVSILFQNPNNMMFKPYVGQDVAYGPENMRLPKDEVERRVSEALFTVGMVEYRNQPIMKLSYGQRKRVSLAGVLAMKPSVLILDEPTAGLDPQMAHEVMEITEQLHTSGVTVIMSSHDTDLVYSWADEIHVINEGKCIYSGVPEPFYDDSVLVQKCGLLEPSVFAMNDAFARLGAFKAEPYPKTQAQLSVKAAGRSDMKFGVLNVLKADKDTDIKAVIEANNLTGLPTGIYGTSARLALGDGKVDFLYNGPENCTMKCLDGQDSLLICDPEVVDKAEASVEFIKHNGFGEMEIRYIS